MNGLTLRISRRSKKAKACPSFTQINISQFLTENLVDNNPLCMQFLSSKNTDEQLTVLKKILDQLKEELKDVTVRFLVAIFFEAEPKHPVKCFLIRHVSKSPNLQQAFSTAMSVQIKSMISDTPDSYKLYEDVVSKLSSCMENFLAGSAALKMQESLLTDYLETCLRFCIGVLKNKEPLSPTEKNEIFNLIHVVLRLLLQFFSHPSSIDISIVNGVEKSLQDLLFDADVPMDTKSVCGILFLTLFRLENGSDAWLDILSPEPKDDTIKILMDSEASQLSLLSAIATVIPGDKVQSQMIGGESALLLLNKNILDIAERSSSDSVIMLGVTRTLLQISKSLNKLKDNSLGRSLVANLLTFVWGHLEHYMDSVRHLTAQILSYIVKFCSKLDKQGDPKALDTLFAAISQSQNQMRKSCYVTLTCVTSEVGAGTVIGRMPAVISDVIEALSTQAVQASATTTLETLLENHAKSTDTSTLCATWVQLILRHVAERHVDTAVLHILENLLVRAARLCEEVIEYIIPHIKNSSASLQCTLMLASVVRRAGGARSAKVGGNGDKGYGQDGDGHKSDAHGSDVKKSNDNNTNGQDGDVHDSDVHKGDDHDSDVHKGDVHDSDDDKGNSQDGQNSDGHNDDDMWRGVIAYNVLADAAVSANEETRILALSLIVESPKTTEPFTSEEFEFVREFVKYNINTQSPNFRQLMLGLLRKLMKRLKDSYSILEKAEAPVCDDYVTFLLCLRSDCSDSLLPGANYSRRGVALQLIAWIEEIDIKLSRGGVIQNNLMKRLLRHLEDSYENNKALALEIMLKYPTDILKTKDFSVTLELEEVMKEVSSMKPTDCVTAAYKLDLIRQKLPEVVLEGIIGDRNPAERVLYELLRILHSKLCKEQAVCEKSIVYAAVNAPMYGTLHCMLHLMTKVDVEAISSDQHWKQLVDDIIKTCFKVNAAVECVVNNSSPEGHLPMDMGGVEDHGNASGIRLEDGRQVTAQMVLLCAWRSVKEVSLLLGEISSRHVVAERGAGTLTPAHLELIGEHFTKLLAETKHRGAFEQAYVGFTKLLARLWRCRLSSLHSLPRLWLQTLMSDIADGRGAGLSATRRSAGLPFMIQALVTTELQVQGNPKCFHECMTTLLRLARTPPLGEEQTETAVETRTHCINILRALFRNSSLDESVAGYVGEGLVVALEGFEGRTWMERNSSTLLFAALVVRVFGVARGRDPERLAARNKMTGRIFFLRYPALYDFMLSKLKEVSSSEDCQVLRPSLYPVLLLLARLYPSALEGTVSNLKLVSFVPHVVSCARGAVLKTRQLAAKAIVPLIAPERYMQHLQQMMDLISDIHIKRNFCHGIMLQVIRLIDAKPASLSIDQESSLQLSRSINNTLWLLQQPCWLLRDEYVKMVNLIEMRFPSLIQKDTIKAIADQLQTILFTETPFTINSGREIALANILYLLFIITDKYFKTDTKEVIRKCLEHSSYEVILSALNYLLIKQDDFVPENHFEEHLTKVADVDNLTSLYEDLSCTEILSKVSQTNKYLECTHKALNVLSLRKDAAKLIVETKLNTRDINDDTILKTLIDCIRNDDNLTHIYLQCLSKYIKQKLSDGGVKENVMLEVIRAFFECSTYDNSETTRKVVIDFLENNIEHVWSVCRESRFEEFTEAEFFEFNVTFYAMIMVALEDDSIDIRLKASNVVWKLQTIRQEKSEKIPRELPSASKAAEIFRRLIETEEFYYMFFDYTNYTPYLIVLGLLDFKSEVCMNDDVSEECRVFDQNERYNIFLEETVWTRKCARDIAFLGNMNDANSMEVVITASNDPTYRNTIEKLCKNNFVLFEKLVKGEDIDKSNAINPKIQLFIDYLR